MIADFTPVRDELGILAKSAAEVSDADHLFLYLIAAINKKCVYKFRTFNAGKPP